MRPTVRTFRESCASSLMPFRESLAGSESARRSLAERAPEVNRVLMVASGDSFFLGYAAIPAFEQLAGIPAEAVEAYDLVTARASVVDRRSLVIGVSASGKALRTVQALEMAARADATRRTRRSQNPTSSRARGRQKGRYPGSGLCLRRPHHRHMGDRRRLNRERVSINFGATKGSWSEIGYPGRSASATRVWDG